ncbi:MAG: DUF421 domain-containing protein [Ruminococcaceae bacterium]|nr:DUF421 domain-containing protein [Oscillospiraceae bacterium]
MITILIRTIIVYVVLIATLRLMGKRQLGELEITELVTTLLISEIATLPIGDPSIPVVYAVIPLITILMGEVTLSVILLKCPRLKNLASARPTVLIRHGEIDQKEMRRIRISVDELISEVRQAGIPSLLDVDYAILEQNGKISVIPRRASQPPDAQTLGLHPPENGILHALIEDGEINDYNLKRLSLDRDWLCERLAERSLQSKKVFYLGIDDCQKLYWIEKESEN